MLCNNIYRQQDIEIIEIINNALFIALISTKKLVNIKSRHGLSPGGFTVRLLKKLIILTLYLKKGLINAQLRSKLPFTL